MRPTLHTALDTRRSCGERVLVRHTNGGTISTMRFAASRMSQVFIYTRCAAVCPLVVRQLARRTRMTVHDARIVSFSSRQTSTRLKRSRTLLERGIDPRVWSLATGRKREILRARPSVVRSPTTPRRRPRRRTRDGVPAYGETGRRWRRQTAWRL